MVLISVAIAVVVNDEQNVSHKALIFDLLLIFTYINNTVDCYTIETKQLNFKVER